MGNRSHSSDNGWEEIAWRSWHSVMATRRCGMLSRSRKGDLVLEKVQISPDAHTQRHIYMQSSTKKQGCALSSLLWILRLFKKKKKDNRFIHTLAYRETFLFTSLVILKASKPREICVCTCAADNEILLTGTLEWQRKWKQKFGSDVPHQICARNQQAQIITWRWMCKPADLLGLLNHVAYGDESLHEA